MSDLRAQFQSRFIAAANTRLRRALAALAAEPTVVYQELHGLAGEAGIMGFAEISTAAVTALELARSWRTEKPSRDQQLACARILRSIMTLVGALERPAAPPARAAAPVLRRALVIDDSTLVAEELADALREASFDVAIASSLEGSVASLRERPPEVVLVDANIPGVDIKVLCDHVREHAAGAKLLVVSAATDDEMRAFAEHVGAHGYVGKLAGTASIVGRVNALVRTEPS